MCSKMLGLSQKRDIVLHATLHAALHPALRAFIMSFSFSALFLICVILSVGLLHIQTAHPKRKCNRPLNTKITILTTDFGRTGLWKNTRVTMKWAWTRCRSGSRSAGQPCSGTLSGWKRRGRGHRPGLGDKVLDGLVAVDMARRRRIWSKAKVCPDSSIKISRLLIILDISSA
jgi:hypothetical protein